jgi:fucose permease
LRIERGAPSLRDGLPYYAAFVGLGLSAAALGPSLPSLADQTRSDLADVSILFSVQSLGYLLGTIAAGRLVDRVQGHPVLVAVLAWLAASLVLVPSFSTLGPTMAFVCTLGLGMGMLDVGCNTLLVWRFRDRAGPYLNGLHCIYGVGAFLSPIVLAEVSGRAGSLQAGYGTLALLLAPAAILLLVSQSPARIRFDASTEQVPFDKVFVAIGAVFFFIYTGAESAAGGWIYTYAVRSGLATDEAGAYVTATFWGAVALGRFVAIAVAVRQTPGRMLIVTLPAAVLSVAVMLVTPGPAIVWAGTFMLGLTVAAVFPTMLALVGERTPISGSVTSLLFASASCGAMFLPWLIGQLFEPLGPRSALVIIGASLALATVLVALLRARPLALRAREGVT